VQQWTAALEHLQSALDILDRSETPSEVDAVGAMLDLAINRLRDAIDKARTEQA
jgi:hypothetical protein